MLRTLYTILTNTAHLLVLVLMLAGLAGCGASSAATAPNSPVLATVVPAAGATGAPEGTMTMDLPAKPGGKLSARLAQLATPEMSAQDPADQAGALGVPASGSGSLIRHANGEVLVVIRASDTSEATQQAIQAAGATITQTVEQLRSMTAYIHPGRLNDLAAIPAVENVREELRP